MMHSRFARICFGQATNSSHSLRPLLTTTLRRNGAATIHGFASTHHATRNSNQSIVASSTKKFNTHLCVSTHGHIVVVVPYRSFFTTPLPSSAPTTPISYNIAPHFLQHHGNNRATFSTTTTKHNQESDQTTATTSASSPTTEGGENIDPRLAAAHNTFNEGFELYSQGKYSESRAKFFVALQEYEKLVPENLGILVTTLNNIAETMRMSGLQKDAVQEKDETGKPKFVEVDAEQYYRRALQLREQLDQHQDTLEVALLCNNLGLFLMEVARRPEDAEPMLERALNIRKEKLGEDAMETAIAINNLALCYNNMRKYSFALGMYEQALLIYEKRVGKEHLAYMKTLNNMGLAYNNLSDYDSARPYFAQALKILEKMQGKDHLSDLATTLNNLALLEFNCNNFKAAEPLYRRSLALCQELLGDNHTTTAIIKLNLGTCLGKLMTVNPEYRKESMKLLNEAKATITANKRANQAPRKSFLTRMLGKEE